MQWRSRYGDTRPKTGHLNTNEEHITVRQIASSKKHPATQRGWTSTSQLPPGVPDIDADGDREPLFSTECLKEISYNLFLREINWPIKRFFLRSQVEVNASIRARHIHCLILTHNALHFLPETLFLAVSLVDHYLQVRIIVKGNMRRLWIAALFLAAKYEETQGPLVSIRFMETMKYISDFQLRDVWEMEKDILRAVNWSLTRPLSVNFLSRNCKAAQATKVEEMTATYILEVCLLDYCMAWVKPSRRAAAALCCALLLLGRPKD
ncbi:hypothetical protein V5799_010586, partial [Amblyomma americanum]